MSRDPQYKKLLNSARWRQLRAQVLSEHPLCQDCAAAGRVAPATEVHHVTPIETGGNMAQKERFAYRRSNLRALCHSCHREAHAAMMKGPSSDEARALSRQRRQSAIETTLDYLDSLTPGGIFSEGEGVR